MEQLLRNVRHHFSLHINAHPTLQVRPEMDIEQAVVSSNSPESVQSAHTPPSIGYSRSTPVTDMPYPTPQTLPDSTAFPTSPSAGIQDLSDEEDLAHITLSRRLSKLALDQIDDRFFGKSR
jgi:hypothetical protein